MKKFVSKIKKVVVAIVLAIISFPNKISTGINYVPQANETSYGVYRPSTVTIIWKIARTFIIPIALLIGLIIYFKRSKSSKKKKILVTIVLITIVAILYFVLNIIIYEFAVKSI